jgi:predicted Holliday junction resolvase-like endonuclease
MQTQNDILLILTVIVLVLTIVIAVLVWQIQQRRHLQERRREVIERENREVEALLREREEQTNKTMKYDNRCNDISDAGCGGAAERHRLESFCPMAQAEA